jgi:hypothetical protein
MIAFAALSFAATTVTFSVPLGTQYIDRYGNTYVPDSSGYINVPSSGYEDAMKAGFTPVTNLGTAGGVTCTKGAVTAVPVGYSQHGSIFVCMSSNKGVTIGKY